MDFYTELDRIIELVRGRGRVSYRAIKEHFGLDDDRLAAIRTELMYAHSQCLIDDGMGLAWKSRTLPQSDAERRQLTVLFCDLVDSTPLFTQLDPEDLGDVMRAYYGTCGDVIAHFDGYIAQYLGDGLLVFFGYPHAHEDDAQRAVRAGLGITEAIGTLNAELGQRHGVELAVRLGCHTGQVVVGEVVGAQRHELMALGDTPHIAARLQGIAAPNTLVIGPLTHRLVSGFFSCRSLGTPSLKGVSAALEVHEVLQESEARSRLEALGDAGLTPLVGRARELGTLEDCWAQVLSGDGRAVLVSGEAGIGKSRLVHALTERAARDGAWLTLCQASPYHRDTAFYPFIDLFERVVLRFSRPASAADKLGKLENFFEQSGLPLDNALPHLCNMLSIPPDPGRTFPDLPPDQQKKETLLALRSILTRRSAQQPVLFVVEDLHWVDPTTLELLTMLVDQISDTRILALFTCRPDFGSPWTENASVTGIDLARLSADEAAELMRRVARNKALPEEIVTDVVAKTDGVPLFIEELTKTLLESDLLEEHASRFRLAGPLPPLAIPNSLHDSLMARLDRLSATKGLAQLGAAIGREFSYPLLRAVSPWSEKILDAGLAQLVASEFLSQRGTPPDATYRFKHALIQDAAYQSLLKSTRQQHHKRIASILEADFPEIVDTQPELVAHHYTEAGLTGQAIPYWHAAGRRAARRYANTEASNHARRGLELLATLPNSPQRDEQELGLQLVLAPSLSQITGPQSVEHIYARALDLARRVGGPAELNPALSGLAYAYIVRGRVREARTLAEEFLALAQPQHDALVSAAGHSMVAYAAWWQGDIVDVRTHCRRCLKLADPAQDRGAVAAYNQNPALISGYLDALSDWMLGYPDAAAVAMDRVLAYARGLGHPYNLGIARLFAAQLSQLMRDPAAAMAHAEVSLQVSSEHGLHAVALWCLLPRGWARVQEGDTVSGIADIREAMDRRRAFGIGAVWPWFLTLLAEALGASGDIEGGLRAVEEAEQWVRRTDERLYSAETHRIRGELLLRTSDPDPVQAQRCFEESLTLSREQHAKSWELRAASSMARMWLQHNRIDDARALLEPVYTWFTEGFATPDLRDARELLQQLS